MGWSYCGKDRKGRDIGYSIVATCDHPDCEAVIDRGLAHACGGMHGEDEYSCENYFCENHLFFMRVDGEPTFLCDMCATFILDLIERKRNDDEPSE